MKYLLFYVIYLTLEIKFTAAGEDKINLSDNIDITGSSCDKLKMLDLTSNYTLIMQFKVM